MLALRGEQALGRQYSAQLFDARQQVADADRPDVVVSRAARSRVKIDTDIDMSASVSRNERYCMPEPGRRLNWTTCPSTHTWVIRAT